MDLVCCPVCTLYMREGVTLQSHLNTHPKDQVIEALVRCSVNTVSVKDNENVPTSIPSNHQDVTRVQNSQYPSLGSSHFTAAITYQQFLSSNSACPGVLPQYVSVPTILTPADANANGNQGTLMPVLYNPYVLQQHQHQLQFVNSVNSQPLIPQVSFGNSSLYPSVTQVNPLPVNSVGQSILRPLSASNVSQINQVTQTLRSPTLSSTSPTRRVHRSDLSLPCQVGKDDNGQDDDSETIEANKSLSKQSSLSPKSNSSVHSNEHHNMHTRATFMQNNEYMLNSFPDSEFNSSMTTQTNDIPLSTQDSYETNDNLYNFEEGCKVQVVPVDEQNELGNISHQPDDGESCEVDVKTDVNISNDTSVRSQRMRHGLNDGCVGEATELVELHNIQHYESTGVERYSQIIKEDKDDQDFQQIVNGSVLRNLSDMSNEYDSSKMRGECMGKSHSQQQVSNVTTVGNSKLMNLETSASLNVIEVDGVNILVPTHFLDNSSVIEGHKLTVIEQTSEVTTMEVPSLHLLKCENSPQSNVNIQSDEIMPARGELSEQESLGGNENSVWIQNYAEAEEEVSTSYDLIARESWEASDGSDTETNMEDLEKQSSALDQNSVTDFSTKTNVKLKKIYTCWSCQESFNCPKERRVHRTLYHSDVRENKNKPQEDIQKTDIIIDENINEGEIKIEEGIEINVESKTSIEIEIKKTDTKTVVIKTNENGNFGTVVKAKQKSTEVRKVETLKHRCEVELCSETFTSPKLLRKHLNTAHKPKQESRRGRHVCGTCHEVFPTEVLFREHLKIHPLECSYCGKFFARKQNLSLHLKRHLGIRPYKCAICDKSFITKQKLAEHTNSHTGNSPLECTLCHESFRRYSNLIQHRNRYHLKLKKKIKDYICHCGEVFHSKKKLEWHKEIHDAKPKSCPFCIERFVHAVSLTRHIRRAHDNRYVPKRDREGENVQCEVCSSFFLRSSLAAHMRVHSGERPFPCQVCGKRFTTKWNLKLHKWTHAARSSKPYKCATCKAAFYRKSSYLDHSRTHRGIKPYTCNYCGCRFIHKFNCLRHVREHETKKSYACTVCAKTFHRRYYLKEHMTVHSGARPYSCHICGKASSTKSNHNKHVKIHHAREPVNTEG